MKAWKFFCFALPSCGECRVQSQTEEPSLYFLAFWNCYLLLPVEAGALLNAAVHHFVIVDMLHLVNRGPSKSKEKRSSLALWV